MTNLKEIKKALLTQVTSTEKQAKMFFKTTPGSYAAHDKFIGVTVPNLRKIAKTFSESNLEVLQGLLVSKINEERLLALIILVGQYQKADGILQKALYQFYMDNLEHVNNWNLVDASAHLILGAHLWDKKRSILEKLARSNNLWERRISIVSTWYFIKKGDLSWTFRIAMLLLKDEHDLIHKAVGWMLREAGKQDNKALLDFLELHAPKMPRTALRYAIEKQPALTRHRFMKDCPGVRQ